MNRFSRRKIIVATLCFCLTVPVSVARPAQSPPSTPQEEFKFGKADLDLLEQVNLLDKRFEREGLVFLDEGTNAYLQRIGESLLPRDLNLEHVIWKFRVLRDPVPNAFALPNGSVYVNTGLIALLDNESQLAAMLAHEITHVLNRHTYLQNRSNRKKYLAINIIAAVGAWNPVGGVAGAAIDVIAAVSPFILETTMFGYSRDLEKEADLKGVDVMMIAEYPPEEMVKALTLLSNDIEGEQLKLFYNDHPQLKDRIGYVTTYLGSKANKMTAASELHRERSAYLAKIETVSQHDIQLAINAARFRTAVYLSQKFANFKPESAENIFWLAESYRTLGPRSPDLKERELTNSAKKGAAKKRAKLMPEEEERELLATSAGQQNWKSNQQKAEELYLNSLKLDHPVPMAHRGLGMLYEKVGRAKEAIDEYQKYLELAPDAVDRERVQRRIQTLRGSN
ncbi:MAG TPA: M48 family metalloprotease [Pyrinomonadaceae bacterium]|nr:M48 family metalloprotease [Pyrinomonadaceae bacterium]